jgi:hypothetical protein
MDSVGKGMNADEERSYFDAYREAGIYFRSAKKNRDLSGFDLIAEALRPTSFVAGNRGKDETAPHDHDGERRARLANQPSSVFGVARQCDR